MTVNCIPPIFLFLRRVLFLSIDDILADEAVVSGDPLPHSYVLNFLFSKAPSEMRSPHQVSSDGGLVTAFLVLILVYGCSKIIYCELKIPRVCNRREKRASNVPMLCVGRVQKVTCLEYQLFYDHFQMLYSMQALPTSVRQLLSFQGCDFEYTFSTGNWYIQCSLLSLLVMYSKNGGVSNL